MITQIQNMAVLQWSNVMGMSYEHALGVMTARELVRECLLIAIPGSDTDGQNEKPDDTDEREKFIEEVLNDGN